MNRLAPCLLAALAASLMPFQSRCSDAADAKTAKGAVIFQEGFEQDPAWNEAQPWKAMNPAMRAEWDSKVFHSGGHSLKVSTGKFAAESKGFMTEGFFPYDGGKIKLSYWVKCEDIRSAGINTWDLGNLVVDYYTADKRNIVHKDWKYHDSGKGMEGTSDWERVEKTFDIPKRDTGVAFLRVWVDLYNCTGTMWVDDIKIERVPEKPKDTATPEQQLSRVNAKKALLEQRVWELEGLLSEAKGRNVESETAALATCKTFLKYVSDDIAAGKAGPLGDNEIKDLMAKGLKKLDYSPKNESFFRVYYQYIEGGGFRLADEEMAKCLEISEAALKSPKGPASAKAASFEDSQEGLSIKNGAFVNKDGRPVFLMGFCFDGGKVDDALRKGLGCNFSGGYWGGTIKSQFYEDEAETPIPMQIDRMLDTLKKRPGMTADFLFMVWRNDGIPQWMLKKDPAIKAPGNHFNGSDPDHPFVAKYDALIYPAVAKALAPHNGTTVPMIMYNLHNEPGFNSYTAHSKAKFAAWLKKAYNGDIAKLNRLYGKQYKDFSEAERDLKGSPAQRYDWFRFNHERTAEMFARERKLVKDNDPKAVCHIKLMPNYWDIEKLVWPAKDGGINYELLEPSMDAMGVDMNVRERSVDGYGMEFRAQGMGYDFYKSIAPEKPIFDSEWHGIGVNTALTDDVGVDGMSPEYVKAAMWHAFLHGLRGMEIWYWSRYWNIELPDLEPAREFNGSILTMPQVLNAYGESAFALRRLAPQAAPFAQAGSKVKLLFSEPSRLLTTRFNKDLMKAYEGLCFLDSPVRFLTDTQAARGIGRDTALIVVPGGAYIGDAAYGALLSYAKAGGEMLLVGDDTLTMTERGEPRDTSALKACPSVRSFASMTRDGYRKELEPALTRLGVERPVRALDADGKPADRIELRSVRHEGKLLCYVINLDDKERAVSIVKDGAPLKGATELISGARLNDGKLVMKRLEVMLLSID